MSIKIKLAQISLFFMLLTGAIFAMPVTTNKQVYTDQSQIIADIDPGTNAKGDCSSGSGTCG